MRRAVLDFVLYRDVTEEDNAAHYKLAAQAAGWLFHDGAEEADEEGRYTFLCICDLLGFEPSSLRNQVLALRREDLGRFSAEGSYD